MVMLFKSRELHIQSAYMTTTGGGVGRTGEDETGSIFLLVFIMELNFNLEMTARVSAPRV